MSAPHRSAREWESYLAAPDGSALRALRSTYGDDQTVRERLPLLRAVVRRYLERFGDGPLRLFRCPGRINLRGMHVDTHGGYLNLMTHQRETVVAASPGVSRSSLFVNLDPQYSDAVLDPYDFRDALVRGGEWLDVLAHDALQKALRRSPGFWGHYLLGCLLRTQWSFPETDFRGLQGVVGSDIPSGAALSSSAALCTAVVDAILAWHGRSLDAAGRILAARDAEWTSGSRCGVSDQAAMILGGRGILVNVALHAKALDVSRATYTPWPDHAVILVINSHTRRNISGTHLVEYTRNRFAYSLALPVLRQIMVRRGYDAESVKRLETLAHFSPAVLPEFGDPDRVYGLLGAVPLEMAVDALEREYEVPDVRASYNHHFGMAPMAQRPSTIQLRGPLLFGLAESERARQFSDLVQEKRLREVGRLMSIGHDGDRQVTAEGRPYTFDISDDALRMYGRAHRPLCDCPGVYGASTPVLDALVDSALAGGALGACLTGAGLAGTVLALCTPVTVEAVTDAVTRRLTAPDYPDLARRTEALTPDEARESVVINRSTSAARELMFDDVPG